MFRDPEGILRVKGKFQCWSVGDENYPILLHKTSYLTQIIVNEIHRKLHHAGIYAVLNEVRKTYWIPNGFSAVRKILRRCIQCRRFNSRTVVLNQSPYKEFNLKPSHVPFRGIFIDHIGPFTVRKNENNVKVYLLIFSCVWSRAINLKVCVDMTVENFLRAMQLHVFQYGVPEICLSDMGSTIVRGSEIISDLLSDSSVVEYLKSHDIKSVNFSQYAKGNSQLGGLVESMVKLTKLCIYGAIRNLVLGLEDFEFLIEQVISVVNKRPIALKETLRDSDVNQVIPGVITPEIILRGYELPAPNLIPGLEKRDSSDPDWLKEESHKSARDNYEKLRKARERLNAIYDEEYFSKLAYQATNCPDRYKPQNHHLLRVNDVVILKEQHHKPNQYPLARVVEVVKNVNSEVTEVIVLKGSTGEKLRRHVSVVIPLLTFPIETIGNNERNEETREITAVKQRSIPKRKAAIASQDKCRDLSNKGLM